jgi:hypothetical protein
VSSHLFLVHSLIDSGTTDALPSRTRELSIAHQCTMALWLVCLNTSNASKPTADNANLGFDIIACGIATYYLIDLNANSVMSKFTKKVMQHGMVSADPSSTSPPLLHLFCSRSLALGIISITYTARGTDRRYNTTCLFPHRSTHIPKPP